MEFAIIIGVLRFQIKLINFLILPLFSKNQECYNIILKTKSTFRRIIEIVRSSAVRKKILDFFN